MEGLYPGMRMNKWTMECDHWKEYNPRNGETTYFWQGIGANYYAQDFAKEHPEHVVMDIEYNDDGMYYFVVLPEETYDDEDEE